MANRGKTMDFYRPARATDPLVSRPKVAGTSVPVQKPNVRSTAMPPMMKTGSGVAPKVGLKRPMVQSSVAMNNTVVRKTTPSATTVTATTSVQRTVSVPSRAATVKTAGAVPTPAGANASKPALKNIPKRDEIDDDAWFDLEKEDFLDEAPKQGKVSYPFGGESPFLKSVKVEKRPLSGSVPKRNVYDGSERTDYRQDPVRVQNKSKKKNSALSLALIILITVILGAAAGVGVFLLIAH